MVIQCDWDGEWLRAYALPGPGFSRAKDTLARAPGRKPVFDGESFLYWKLPKSSLRWIINQFGDGCLSLSCGDLHRELKEEDVPISDLDLGDLKVSSADRKDLKGYQQALVCLPNEKKKLLVSMPTGTGKTFTALMRCSQVGFRKLLIVGPRKLKVNWRSECRAALGRELLIYWGTKAQREKLRKRISEHDIFYVTFEQLSEFHKYAPQFDQVIIDEIHIVCNPATQAHKALYAVVQDIPYRLGLSATPMRLRMKDLWGVLRLIDPELAGDKHYFLEQYEEVLATLPVRKGNYTIHVPIKVRSKNEEQLREHLSSIMYRPKVDKGFKDRLPEIIQVELTPRQSRLYEECRKNILLELSEGSLDITNALARMMRLQQISEGLFNVDPVYSDSGKVSYLQEALQQHMDQGDKVVVCSRFEPISREVKSLFPRETVLYTGKESDTRRTLAEYAFQGVNCERDREDYERQRAKVDDFSHLSPGDAKIFVATHSLESMMGINLDAAHIVYFTSWDWNPNVVFQARDRVSRLTQAQDTETYFLCSEDTIDNRSLRKIFRAYEECANVLDGRRSETAALARDMVGLLYD